MRADSKTFKGWASAECKLGFSLAIIFESVVGLSPNFCPNCPDLAKSAPLLACLVKPFVERKMFNLGENLLYYIRFTIMDGESASELTHLEPRCSGLCR